jgi:peptidoglycan/LPS O-acetylase OafA/YrhL
MMKPENSIYMKHLFALGVLRVLWIRLVPTATMSSSIAIMGVSLVLCAVVGWICFVAVERPIMRRLASIPRNAEKLPVAS